MLIMLEKVTKLFQMVWTPPVHCQAGCVEIDAIQYQHYPTQKRSTNFLTSVKRDMLGKRQILLSA